MVSVRAGGRHGSPFPGLWGGTPASGEPRGRAAPSREVRGGGSARDGPAFTSGWRRGAAGRSGAPRGGPGPRRPLGGSRRRASPPQQPLRRGNPSARSPLHLPPSPASQPGQGRPRPPSSSRRVCVWGGVRRGSRPRSGGPSLPPTSTPAPYPAGACPSGRPLIHLAPLPSEVTKPAWQWETPRSSGKCLPQIQLLTFTRRLQLRHPASPAGPAPAKAAGKCSPPAPPPHRPPAGAAGPPRLASPPQRWAGTQPSLRGPGSEGSCLGRLL